MPSQRIPKLGLHKATGQAVVRLDGRDRYLGRHGTPRAQRAYEELIARWLAHGRSLPDDGADDAPTVTTLAIAYTKHCEAYYRRPDGTPTGEVKAQRRILKRLRAVYGSTRAAEFGPRSLIAFRETLVEAGLARGTINQDIGRVKRMFKWCASQELIPVSVFEALRTIDGLRRGRSAARETKRVQPVPEADFQAVLPHLSPMMRALVRTLWYTGARVGELLTLTTGDLDRRGATWIYRPETHKNSYREQAREIYFGPEAQAVIRPLLQADPAAPVFSPKRGMEAIHAGRRAARQTPMTPSQRARKPLRNPKRAPGETYTVGAVRRAIRRACDDAGVPHWTTHQIRHAAGTRIREAFGLDASQAVLGHASLQANQVYSEVSRKRALEVVAALG